MNIAKEDSSSLNELAGKKFMITGAKGMLGSAFYDQINKYIKNPKIYYLDKSQLDVTNINAFDKYFDLKPDFIIHCASLVNADECETNKEKANEIIIKGTENIIKFASKNNSKIFYPQSFLIHNNIDEIINEETKPKPLSVYGNLKLEAENIIVKSSIDYLSVCMGGFFGGLNKDKNFVGKIILHISKLIKTGKKSLEIGNRIWQPTFTNDLAFNSLLLMANKKSGKFCMSSHGYCSFFDLTKKILGILNISEKINLLPVSAKILDQKEIATRPLSIIMKNERLLKENLDRQRNWVISLKDYLSNPYFAKIFK